MQAFVFNTRRKQFQDPRVRRAFNLAFNFEAANKNLFYGQYIRVDSYFCNTEMERTAAAGSRRDPERGQGPGAAGGVHGGVQEPGRRLSHGAPQELG